MADAQTALDEAKAASKAKEAHIKAVNDENVANERALNDVAARKEVCVCRRLVCAGLAWAYCLYSCSNPIDPLREKGHLSANVQQ